MNDEIVLISHSEFYGPGISSQLLRKAEERRKREEIREEEKRERKREKERERERELRFE